MTDERRQLPLFASSESRSSSDAPSSHRSSESKTSSNEPSTRTTTDAAPTIPTRHAPASSASGGVTAAAKSSRAAKPTEASAQLPITSAFISPSTADPMYAIPRPKTRAECRDEARPCPWVGCKHHLLLEVAKAKVRKAKDPRATTLRLNRSSSGVTTGGRRPGLRSSAAAAIVRAWIDDAVEALSYMPYTCALDVVDAFPDGLSPRRVGWVLAVTEQAIDAEGRKPAVVEAIRELKEFTER